MTDKKELKDFYSRRLFLFNEKYEMFRKKERNTNIFRGLTFLIGTGLAIVLANFSLFLMTTVIIVSVVCFLVFVQKNAEFRREKEFNFHLKQINENELKALDNDNSAFLGGKEFIDKKHNYSFDLDIFGDKSIFQKVNRTITKGGYELLANGFMNPEKNISKILEIQQNTLLFENQTQARQEFIATGRLFDGEISGENIKNLSKAEYFFSKNNLWKILAWVLIFSTLTAILLASYDFINPFVPLFLFLTEQGIIMFNSKKTKTLSDKIEKNTKAFQKYRSLFDIVENMENCPEKFSALIKAKTVSKALKELAVISQRYEQRHNFMFAIFGQGIFLYDVLINLRFEKWEKQFCGEIENWFSVIAEYDFLFSLATLKFNNPSWCFPKPKEEKFILNAKNAGHPLIKDELCVRNDIKFSDRNFLIILTGANMAGKSTYLRTIGTNLILSQLGAVVCAEKFEFSPVELYTSIRTSDSVQDNQSYFFAELKRLEQIIKRLENGETLFIIVDEMLRGTNSKDKHDGSEKFVKKLLNYNCYGIFATHDIDIGNIKNDFPQNVDTKCFEISFNGGELVFDYKIKDGISQNLNASFLMKKMGIID